MPFTSLTTGKLYQIKRDYESLYRLSLPDSKPPVLPLINAITVLLTSPDKEKPASYLGFYHNFLTEISTFGAWLKPLLRNTYYMIHQTTFAALFRSILGDVLALDNGFTDEQQLTTCRLVLKAAEQLALTTELQAEVPLAILAVLNAELSPALRTEAASRLRSNIQHSFSTLLVQMEEYIGLVKVDAGNEKFFDKVITALVSLESAAIALDMRAQFTKLQPAAVFESVHKEEKKDEPSAINIMIRRADNPVLRSVELPPPAFSSLASSSNAKLK